MQEGKKRDRIIKGVRKPNVGGEPLERLRRTGSLCLRGETSGAVHGWEGRQAGKQEGGRERGRQVSRQAGREGGRERSKGRQTGCSDG